MKFINILYEIIWGPPLLIAIVATGIMLTYSLRGLQFRYFKLALQLLIKGSSKSKKQGDIRPFQSLMTNMAGTIGIGNLAGVATALAVGGLGSLFWMWVTACIGMATLYSEAFLAVKYRVKDKRGEMCGGPMYVISRGLNNHKLAFLFALLGSFAAFGGGNLIQANSVADVMQRVFLIPNYLTAIVLFIIIASILLGGIKSIGKVASILVPLMGILYLTCGCVILAFHLDQIPSAIFLIIKSAFTGQAAFGGFAGSSMITAMQTGVCRGVMTTEAGLGTAGIVAAAAKTDSPEGQGLISMTGSFFSTLLICTITGLVLTVTDAFGQVDINGKLLNGASMTVAAFNSTLPYGGEIVAVSLLLFALTTILAWGYYGEKCLEYILGENSVVLYRTIFCIVLIPGALLDLELVWKISDITNGLMAIPNLIGIFLLAKVVVKQTAQFLQENHSEEKTVSEGTLG
ncbi:MAG: sodium:alanine symporter family protein [Waddliaceae bacterium]